MKAADTNLILRLMAEDDEDQTALVRAVMQEQPLHVSLTVAIEVEWVLRSAYRWDRVRIANGLQRLTDLDGIHVEEGPLVRWAADRLGNGADFADMIHLIATRNMTAFVTFDRKLKKGAGGGTPLPIEILKTS